MLSNTYPEKNTHTLYSFIYQNIVSGSLLQNYMQNRYKLYCAFRSTDYVNEEQIIPGCPIDGANSVRVDSGFGSYRWFVYITTLLLRDASWILILHCGPPEPPQRHLYG